MLGHTIYTYMAETENNENLETVMDIADEAGDTDPRVYELGYHIIPAVSEEEAPKEAAAIKEFIVAHGGTPISEQEPKHMTLAYPMYRTENGKKETFEAAYFGGIKFEMNPADVIEVKNVLDINKNILRHIIFKTVKENTRAEVRLPQTRSERSERSDRTERKQDVAPKTSLRKAEESVPVSEKALDESIKEIVVE